MLSAVDALDNANFVKTFATEFELDAGMLESELGELTNTVLYTGGDDEVLRFVLLENEPHALYIVLGIAPVAEAVHIAQVEAVLQALADAGSSEGDLTGDEGLATALTLVVEQNT